MFALTSGYCSQELKRYSEEANLKRCHENVIIALRGRSKNRTGYLETTQMGRTNKARLAVCSKAIVKREYLAFVFFSRLDGYNQTLLLGGE